MIPSLISLISLATHLFRFGFPRSVVFDEVFYGGFMSSYWNGNYFFDLHPPFFKLLMSAIGYLTGANNYPADWSSIGNSLPTEVVILRIVPLIAGIALPLIIYYICRRLNFSKVASFTSSTLICLENSLVVQSRYILPDITMLLVGFAAILLYLEHCRRIDRPRSSLLFIGSTIFAALAFSIKWTGLTFLFIIFVMEIFRLYGERKDGKIKPARALQELISFAMRYFVIAAAIYTLLFAIHFAALPYSGKGDAFMTSGFQKTLIGNPDSGNPAIRAETFPEKFAELNIVMFASSKSMTATHPYSSKWYTWPFMERPIFYWQSDVASTSPTRSYIYLTGNPFIYWLGTFSMILLIASAFVWISFKRFSFRDRQEKKVFFILIIAYLSNLLPFIFIGRVMFLYHYEVALVFSIISIGFLVDFLSGKKKTVAVTAILIIALSAFLYWSPLTYGLPLTDQQLQSRIWLPSWR